MTARGKSVSGVRGPAGSVPQPDSRKELIAWCGSFAAALAIHAAAGALLLLDFGEPPQPLPENAQAPMIVELADAAVAPTTPTSDMPVGPEQQEQDVLRPSEDPPMFKPPPEAKGPPPPDALPIKRETATPASAAVLTEQTSASTAALADAGEKAKAPVEGASNADASAANQSWEGRLLAHLHRYKRYPAAARALRQEDVVYLQFKIDRSGRVLSSRLARSRGFAPLDAEVASLIQRASPLPPPPATMGGDSIEMVVPIEFYLRPSLARR